MNKTLRNSIAFRKAIYDHSNKARKGLFPGGPDDYRYNSYVRDDDNESFSVYPVVANKVEAAAAGSNEKL